MSSIIDDFQFNSLFPPAYSESGETQFPMTISCIAGLGLKAEMYHTNAQNYMEYNMFHDGTKCATSLSSLSLSLLLLLLLLLLMRISPFNRNFETDGLTDAEKELL